MSSDRHLEELAATCDRLRVERDQWKQRGDALQEQDERNLAEMATMADQNEALRVERDADIAEAFAAGLAQVSRRAERAEVERDAARADRIHEINRAREWRLAADTWQQRALAAEARVAGYERYEEEAERQFSANAIEWGALTEQVATASATAAAELDEAAEDVANWGAYAGEYFAEKWDLAGDIARLKAAADRFRAVGVSGSAGRTSGASDAAPNEPHCYCQDEPTDD